VSKKQGIHQQGKGNYSYSYDSRSKALGVCNKTLQKEREEYEEGEKRRSTSVSYFPETDVDIRNVQEFKLEVSIMSLTCYTSRSLCIFGLLLLECDYDLYEMSQVDGLIHLIEGSNTGHSTLETLVSFYCNTCI